MKYFLYALFFCTSLSSHAAASNESRYVKLPDGSLYSGELKYNVIREGVGHNKWPNGREYNGEWFNDQPHGKGTLMISDKSSYTGEFVYGSYHGFGQLKQENSSVFTGQFLHGEQSGVGLLESVNGEFFLGEFLHTQKHGRILYFTSASDAPQLQIWIQDKLERVVDKDTPDDQQLHKEFINQMLTMARSYRSENVSRLRLGRQGGVRRQLQEVENPIENTFGKKIIQLLEIYNE